MFTKRIIPCLDVKNGRVVKGVNFVDLKDAGDPVEIAKAYDKAGADELVFLDITASSDDRSTVVDMVRKVAECVFIPFTVGGGIRTVDDFKALLREGADKISINSSAINRPELIREAKFIPETRGINLLFRGMQSEKIQMVIVADEYGQTAGLVTMEDILEEIVGNIQDEYDKDVEFIHRDGNGDLLMDGMTPLADVEETLGVSFDETYDTLNGLLISRLDRIPEDGEKAEITENGYLFQIIEVKNKMIHLVKITKLQQEEKEQ